MASKAVDRTVADFIAGALNPPLIMAMVGSLVFFLVDILYDGSFRGSLQWVLFFFVFGMVLVARIALHADLSRKAAPYGLLLGVLVWIALQRYVDYSENPALAERAGLVNFGLILLICWSTYCLTKDCTQLDNVAPAGGPGLLDEAGLDKPIQPAPAAPPEKPAKTPKKKPADPPGLDGWWQRFCRYLEERKNKPRVLGVWVVYFSLAALPLFGLGQAQIPVDDLARRRYTFSLLLAYVGAGLGLLLTTSFLSLRAYLRQRKVTMPLGITFVWLVLGAGLIGAHLYAATLLPRPADPQPLWDWTGITAGSADRDPSFWSPFDANETRRKRNLTPKKDGQSAQKDDQGEDPNEAKKDDGDAKSDANGKSSSKQQAKSSSGKKNQRGNDQNDREDGDKTSSREQSSGRTPPGLGPYVEFLAKAARFLVIALLAILVIFVVGRGLLRFLANFTFWAQKLLAFFESFEIRIESGGEEPKKPVRKATPRPFASFADPFQSGKAEIMSPVELVRYSFAALQAWGRERALPRGTGETALEYARRIGKETPTLGAEARDLAALYARLAYSTDMPSDDDVQGLRDFWEQLADAGTTAASA